MKISYLVTCHNEDTSLDRCITTLVTHKDDEDEILILDDFSDNPKTKEILQRWQYAAKITMLLPTGTVDKFPNVRVIQHALDKNYGGHKNYGNEQCTGDWVFQIDGDEIPNPTLIINLKDIIQANESIDLIFVPRINDFIGVTDVHARQWGWRLSPLEDIIHERILDTDSYEYQFLKKNGYILEEAPI